MTSPGWFVDALDVRGGIVFGSLREPEAAEAALDLDRPAFVASAPTFRREVVSSRAIGLAASRGTFQYGLFLDGRELQFASAEDLVEFARRAYLGRGDDPGGGEGLPERPFGPPAGGGDAEDDGADGDGGPDGPAPGPDDGPDFLGSDGPNALDQLRSVGSVYQSAVSRLDHAAGLPWPLDQMLAVASDRVGGELGQGMTWTSPGSLVHGLCVLANELASRGPQPRLDHEADEDWVQAVRAVGETTAWLGLTHDVVERLSPARQAWSSWRHSFVRDTIIDARFAAPGPDDLASWPVPPQVASHARLPTETATVLELLCRVLADPRLLAKAPAEMVEIVLLAAIHVQSTHMTGRKADLNERVTAATTWLAGELPACVFPSNVEALISPPPIQPPEPEPRWAAFHG